MSCPEYLRCWRRVRFTCVLAIAFCAIASAQDSQPSSLPPGELVRLAVANEVAAADRDAVKHIFVDSKRTPKGSQTRLYVETSDAMAALLIAVDNHPLSPEQLSAENAHLDWLINNPDQLHKKRAHEKEDAERTLRIVKALPSAFRYQYDGTENIPAGTLVRLSFTPNPGFSPPSHIEQVLTGMKGFLLIDPTSRRLARIDGTLFRDVTFGWGIAGRLYKGGSFVVQQADIGDGDWEITEMHLNITGEILFFKSLNMVSDEVFTDFRRVPDNLTFAQGVKMLRSEEEKRANEAQTSTARKIPQ
jgi:hypothetical protein